LTYDPKSAAQAFRQATRPSGSPVGAPVNQAYSRADRPQTLCILLLGFVAGTAVLPDDFDNVERTATALKAHVRPDGGVYLGAYQAPRDAAGVVVVFGDPLMEQKEAMQSSIVFRGKLLAQMDRFDAAKALGPFAPQPVED
jgi:hypothetical protein